MPVRDRRYENVLQFIFGALIFAALVWEVGKRIPHWWGEIAHRLAGLK
jgi:hypothetical protein